MKHRIVLSNLLLLALSLAVAPTALASSTWYVDGVNGSDSNNCKTRLHPCKTIGHAISLAYSGDSISVAAATYRENLTITFSLKIVGGGAKTTIIDGRGKGSVVTISDGLNVTLSRVTIHNGSAPFGGGIYNGDAALRINDSVVSQNTATSGRCTENCMARGGGIYNGGSITINNSAIIGNEESSGACSPYCGFFNGGGGIYNVGQLMIRNSTLSGNRAKIGGGIYNNGYVMVSNCTLSGNSSPSVGGIVFGLNGNLWISSSTLSGNFGTNIVNFESLSTVVLQNSIVANSERNCFFTVTSNGYNLSSDDSCKLNSTGDLNNTDPKLGQLGNHGGPTQTIPLLSGSPAIDAGNPTGCTDGTGHLLKTDQRGKPRPDKEDSGGCDMGAYERQSD